MRTASKILLALPAAGVAFDAYLWHFPFYAACLVLVLCLVMLASRAWHKLKPVLHRFAAACILVVCRPRKNHEPRLHAFCYPDHA